MIRNGGHSSIIPVPFRDITLPLHNMHPSISGGHDEDCTHYCYFPQMWQQVWYYMYIGAFNLPIVETTSTVAV